MTFSTRNFDPLTPLALKFPTFAIQLLLFCLQHTDAVVTHAHVLQNFYTTWVRGCCLPKTTFRTKIGGGWTRGASEKCGTTYVFLQLLKLATSNLVHDLGLALAYQKQRLGLKLAGSGPGEHPKKIGTSYLFLQPLKLATSNLVHKLGLGLVYQKTTFRTKIGGSLGQGSIQKNLGPLLVSVTVEASNFKFGTQLGFGTILPQKQRLGPKLAGAWARGVSVKNLDPLFI